SLWRTKSPRATQVKIVRRSDMMRFETRSSIFSAATALSIDLKKKVTKLEKEWTRMLNQGQLM
ncbi:hypothetical protein MK163_10150, partial [bacterium]|nr:hypothetical protein [bacterium]